MLTQHRRPSFRGVFVSGLLVFSSILPLGSVVRAEQVDVIEFFHPLLGHYFMTAGAGEVPLLDSGGAGGNWVRTGQSFKAWTSDGDPPASAFPVCRFYSRERNSHFYTASPTECDNVKSNDPGWIYEGIAFYIERPDNGICAEGLPVVRSYNDRFAQNDSNHRYATLDAIVDQMTALGWIREGVAMCTRGAITNGGIAPLQASAMVYTDTAETLRTTDGARLDIPLGAVAPTPSGGTGAANITMAVDTTSRIALPEGGTLGSRVYHLSPSGHVFQRLATVTLPLTVDPAGQGTRMFIQRADGTTEDLQGYYDAATNSITAQTLHFSSPFVVIGDPRGGASCLRINNNMAGPYNAKNFCISAVNSLNDPTETVDPDAGGSVSGPHDVVYGFAQTGWLLPAGNYDICVESWDRPTQSALPTLRGSHVYSSVNLSYRSGAPGFQGDGCATELGVGRLSDPVSPSPCACGATTPTPGGTGSPLEISLNWRADPGVDLDLIVTEPSGETIAWDRPPSVSGGQLDWDNHCGNYANGRTENISWTAPPSGMYRIVVDYFGGCAATSESPIQFTVNVTRGGTTQSYSSRVGAGESETVADVTYAGQSFGYSGYATYDGQPATLSLNINGSGVTGSLNKEGVCGNDVRLTQTTLNLTGTLSGIWGRGQSGAIAGTWTGGDSVCGTQLTAADGYPQAGDFNITREGNVVRLLRTGPSPALPTGWTYDFSD